VLQGCVLKFQQKSLERGVFLDKGLLGYLRVLIVGQGKKGPERGGSRMEKDPWSILKETTCRYLDKYNRKCVTPSPRSWGKRGQSRLGKDNWIGISSRCMWPPKRGKANIKSGMINEIVCQE